MIGRLPYAGMISRNRNPTPPCVTLAIETACSACEKTWRILISDWAWTEMDGMGDSHTPR